MSELATQSLEVDKIGVALSKAQGKLKNVEKTKKGVYRKYADLADCLEAVRDIFSEYEIAIVQSPIWENDKQLLETKLVHSGQWFRSTIRIDSADNLVKGNVVQAEGAEITYKRRYALMAMAGLAPEDDDAECLSVKAPTPPKPKINWVEPVPVNQEDVIALSKELQRLCEENDIKSTEFATVFAISSKNKDSVRNAVQNFDSMKEDFKQMTEVKS